MDNGIFMPHLLVMGVLFRSEPLTAYSREIKSRWIQTPSNRIEVLDDQSKEFQWNFELPSDAVNAEIVMSFHIPGTHYDDIIVYANINTSHTDLIEMDIMYADFKDVVSVVYYNGTIAMKFSKFRISYSGELLAYITMPHAVLHTKNSLKVYSTPVWETDLVSEKFVFLEGSTDTLNLRRNIRNTPDITSMSVNFKPCNKSDDKCNPIYQAFNDGDHIVYRKADNFNKFFLDVNHEIAIIEMYFVNISSEYVGHYDILLNFNVSGVSLYRSFDVDLAVKSEPATLDVPENVVTDANLHTIHKPTPLDDTEESSDL